MPAVVSGDHLVEEAAGLGALAMDVLAHGGERRSQGRGEGHVVEADHREVVRHRQPGVGGRAHHAGHDAVGEGEHPGGPVGGRLIDEDATDGVPVLLGGRRGVEALRLNSRCVQRVDPPLPDPR